MTFLQINDNFLIKFYRQIHNNIEGEDKKISNVRKVKK